MTETPYDADRNRFSREGLARLVLCDHAVSVAESAAGLVSTRHDHYGGPGGRISEAIRLVELAERVLASAVVYERERGSSWEEIAHYLGIETTEAEARFADDLGDWAAAFAVPFRLDETGRKRLPQLPSAAYDPARACQRLDGWAYIHHILTGDEHAVSAGLSMMSTVEEPPGVQ